LKEIELLAFIDRWEEVFSLSKNFLNNQYDGHINDALKFNYIVSVIKLSKNEEIKNISDMIISFNYSDECQIIFIVQQLFLYGYKKLSLELLFKNANNKNNIKCRSYFLHKHKDYYSFYKEYDVVEIGCNVVYRSNGDIYQKRIINTKDKIQQELINKRKGDIVKMKRLSQIEQSIEIISICDDYNALIYELFNEANDPANSLGVELIKFNENNPEEFINLILSMSNEKSEIIEDVYKNEFSIEVSIDSYKNKKISLWEICYLHCQEHFKLIQIWQFILIHIFPFLLLFV